MSSNEIIKIPTTTRNRPQYPCVAAGAFLPAAKPATFVLLKSSQLEAIEPGKLPSPMLLAILGSNMKSGGLIWEIRELFWPFLAAEGRKMLSLVILILGTLIQHIFIYPATISSVLHCRPI